MPCSIAVGRQRDANELSLSERERRHADQRARSRSYEIGVLPNRLDLGDVVGGATPGDGEIRVTGIDREVWPSCGCEVDARKTGLVRVRVSERGLVVCVHVYPMQRINLKAA